MWVITERGEFFSAVDSKNHEMKVVRARDKRSIRAFEEFVNAVRDDKGEPVEVLTGVGTDYEYRIECYHEEWQEFLMNRAETARATNVKNIEALWQCRREEGSFSAG